MPTQPSHDGCPHCGARLVKRTENCLACGAPLTSGRTSAFSGGPSGVGGGGGMNLTTILVILIVVLGAGFLISVGTCGGAAIDTAQKFQNGEIKSTSTVCVSADDDPKIRDLMNSGYAEIDAQENMRCFRK